MPCANTHITKIRYPPKTNSPYFLASLDMYIAINTC